MQSQVTSGLIKKNLINLTLEYLLPKKSNQLKYQIWYMLPAMHALETKYGCLKSSSIFISIFICKSQLRYLSSQKQICPKVVYPRFFGCFKGYFCARSNVLSRFCTRHKSNKSEGKNDAALLCKCNLFHCLDRSSFRMQTNVHTYRVSRHVMVRKPDGFVGISM